MWFNYVYETKLNSTLSIYVNILKLEPLVDWIERVDSIGKLPYGFLEKQMSWTNTDYPPPPPPSLRNTYNDVHNFLHDFNINSDVI